MPLRESGLALRGNYGFSKRMTLWRIRNNKGYRCWVCGEDIPARLEHVFFRHLHNRYNGFNHYHAHILCTEKQVIPDMTGVQEIPFEWAPLKRPEGEVPNEIHRMKKRKLRAEDMP